jgi:hypothetical protein
MLPALAPVDGALDAVLEPQAASSSGRTVAATPTAKSRP